MPSAEITAIADGGKIPGSTSVSRHAAAPARSSRQPELVISASMWAILGYASSQALRLGNNMFLSYWLAPEAFGTMAIVNVVLMGLGMFSDIGVGHCIVQNPDGDRPEFLDTAFLVQAIRGVGIAMFAAAIAWPISAFYQQPSLAWLIPVAGTSAIANGLCSTAIFVLQRNLDLRTIAWLDLRAQLCGSITMCILAAINPSVWALVFGTITTAVCRSALSHRMLDGFKNQFRFRPDYAQELYRFGRWIVLSTLLFFATMQIDRIMLAKLIDIGTLGLYSLGLAIALLPSLMIEKLSTSVLFSVLARSREVSGSLLTSELRSGREVISVVGLASVFSIFVGSRPFFELIYHEDYHAAGTICRWLCAMVWISVLSLSLSRALMALGNTRSWALVNLAKLVCTIPAALILNSLWGLPGFTLGLALGAVCGHVFLTIQLAWYGIVQIGQDIRLSVALGTAVIISVLMESFHTLSDTQRLAIDCVLCLILWGWAILVTVHYRAQRVEGSPSPLLRSTSQ